MDFLFKKFLRVKAFSGIIDLSPFEMQKGNGVL